VIKPIPNLTEIEQSVAKLLVI